MPRKNVLQLSAVAVFVSALLGAHGAQAGPLRYDDGTFTGNSGLWNPQGAGVTFGNSLDLGFGLDFFGGTATSVQVTNSGTLNFLSGTTTLGSVTIADSLASSAIFGRAAGSALDPLPALGGDPVTDGFRVQWTFANGLQAQLALFALGSGGSLLEFNYLTNVEGVDYSNGAIPLGIVDPLSGTGFDLLSYLTASQPGCLKTFGRGVLVADPTDPTDGCTSYFVDNAFSSVALPSPFITTNGGAVGDDSIADYRYLLRYSATTTPPPPPPPPTTVPEPATLALLTAGLAALAATRRRRRDN